MKHIHDTIHTQDGDVIIYGGNRWAEIRYTTAGRAYFHHYGRRYYLDDILAVDNSHSPAWSLDYDGYAPDSYFSGILVQTDEYGERVRAFTYIS